MKRAKRFLSILAILSILATLQIPLVAEAEGAVYETPIYDSFDEGTGLDLGGWVDSGTNHSWAQNGGTLNFVPSNGILGRVAEEGDLSLEWLYDGVSGTSNTLFFMPQRGSQAAIDANRTWGAGGAVPAGYVTEISFDFAADNGGLDSAGGYLEFTVNAAGDHHAAQVIIPYRGAGYENVISDVTTFSQGGAVAGQTIHYPLAMGLKDVWHNLKFVLLYDEAQNGKAMVYMDDMPLIAEPMSFTYTGMSGLPGNLGTYSNGSVWSLLFRNTTDAAKPYHLYIDNLRMSVRDDTKLSQAIVKAEESLADPSAFAADTKAALEAELAAAKAVEGNTGTELASQRRSDYLAQRLLDAVEACETGMEFYIPKLHDDFNVHAGLMVPGHAYSLPGLYNLSANTAWGYNDFNGIDHVERLAVDPSADPSDKALRIKNINYLFNVPKRGNNLSSTGRAWGLADPYATYIPVGETVEYSFDLAVKINGTKVDVPQSFGYGGEMEITVNALADSNPIGININNDTGAIYGVNSMSAQQREEVRLAMDLNPDGDVVFHRITFLVKHNDDHTGKATAYIDGEPVGKVFDFTYTDDPGSLPGMGDHSRSEVFTVMYRNLTDDDLYIDNVTTRIINSKKTVIEPLLEDAYALYQNAELGTKLGQYDQETLDELKAAIEDAYSVLNGEKTDINGLPVAGVAAVMYSQDEIDAAIDSLELAVAEFPKKAISQELSLAKSGTQLTATYKKKSFEALTMDVKIFLCVYGEDNHLLAVAEDIGNGTLSFEDVPADGVLKELTAVLDTSTIEGASYATAFAWNSLTGMQPLTGAADRVTLP